MNYLVNKYSIYLLNTILGARMLREHCTQYMIHYIYEIENKLELDLHRVYRATKTQYIPLSNAHPNMQRKYILRAAKAHHICNQKRCTLERSHARSRIAPMWYVRCAASSAWRPSWRCSSAFHVNSAVHKLHARPAVWVLSELYIYTRNIKLAMKYIFIYFNEPARPTNRAQTA